MIHLIINYNKFLNSKNIGLQIRYCVNKVLNWWRYSLIFKWYFIFDIYLDILKLIDQFVGPYLKCATILAESRHQYGPLICIPFYGLYRAIKLKQAIWCVYAVTHLPIEELLQVVKWLNLDLKHINFGINCFKVINLVDTN